MASSVQLIRVFVYGTLKRGQPNHYLMNESKNGSAKFIAKAKTIQKFPLVVATRYNIPFLLNKPGFGNPINGEIYEVDTPMFAALDKLEDYPHWYDRQIHEMETEDGNIIPCWIYMLKSFPEKMLQLEFLTNYENRGDMKYVESEECTLEEMIEDIKNAVIR